MLEVVMPGIRHGRGVINSSSAYRGNLCYIAGVNADGYQLLQLPYSSAQATKALYPVNKYYFGDDYNDTSDSVDKLTKGDLIVYYEGGEYITDKTKQVLNTMGAKDISGSVSGTPPQNLQAGGCRFGHDPAGSVLDKDCRVHSSDNVFVTDGSWMPTGGSVPYTWTIYANSFRVAEIIKNQL